MHMLQIAGAHHKIGDHSLHCNNNNTQHGFCRRRSCEAQQILMVDDLAGEIDRGGQRCNPTGLLENLWQGSTQASLVEVGFYGVRGKTKRWFEDFLSNRTQQVVVEGEHSYTDSVASDIPQGIYPRAIALLDLYQSVPLCWWHYSLLSHQHPHRFTQLQHDLRTLESWERRWLMSFYVTSPTDNDQEKEQDPHELHPPQLNPLESCQCKVPWSRELTENLHWGKHPVICCKSWQSECLCIQEPEGMSTCCPDTLLQRPCVPSDRDAPVVWPPLPPRPSQHQQHLKSTLEMMQ